MPDNAEIGAVLRDLRKSRHLTLAVVARHAGCAESLVSYIESGRRQLHPWLATKLDEIYRTGGVITALMRDERPSVSGPRDEVSQKDTLVVELPEGGGLMPLSRRELLASLGAGIGTGPLLRMFESAIEKVSIGDSTLQAFDDAYAGYQTAARSLRPSALIDGLTGSVAILDGLRRRTMGHRRNELLRMQARYAESLSWLSEEAGDLTAAMYWIDRTSQWGLAANWREMSAYCFVRRSMMAISFTSDGHRAVDNASAALNMNGVSPRIQGLAEKQIAFGHALTGDESASNRALDRAMHLLAKPTREDDALLGQRSVVDDDLFAIFSTTCDIYLGLGQSVVPLLQPRLASLSTSSVRTATITRAKLARAYANAGQPDEAAHFALAALDDIDRIGSLSARSELRRALPNLSRWRGREDVQTVIRRLIPTV
ncbi:helix-turn-helix domain-containing protein [Nocardia cyriacigeorgica]|uniref:helix-turn-helix domain-containing protein n=1 Tax=Nocardia cyriacigeorgica TaxID=135487 RepID=UPI0013D121F4|nr:helix-turn-helix transcriptional regulator [Nocardia cyriacigeorgica]NEW29265.1 helix-turn-helix domain-containing protein [Nocardia cyriacigeorgica]